jgi:hypothetical protein
MACSMPTRLGTEREQVQVDDGLLEAAGDDGGAPTFARAAVIAVKHLGG